VYLIMFATLLRRWRLAAPLTLVGMVSILVGAMALTPASAHGDRPLTFSGSAAAAQAQLSGTVFVTASFDACDTGTVTKHGSSFIDRAASEEIAFVGVTIAGGLLQADILDADGPGQCFSSATSHRTGDGVGTVTTHAFLTGKPGEIESFTILLPGGPLKIFALGGDVSSTSSAFCKHEGTAHASSATSVFGFNVSAAHPFGQYFTDTFHDITGQAFQPIFGLPDGYSGFLNERTTSAKGDHASATSIAVELFGPGYHEVIGASHADIKCPK